MQLVRGDLQSSDLLHYLLNQEQIDTVMHFAAQVLPPSSPLCGTTDSYCLVSKALSQQDYDFPALNKYTVDHILACRPMLTILLAIAWHLL